MAESDERDRFSELPDSLLLEILSLLEIKDVVRTTVLAKPWKDLWTTVPCLDFGDSFRSLVEGALAKWKGAKILKFRIAFRKVSPPASDMLDSWLLIPIQKQVEDLFIKLKPNMNPEYSAPQCLYSCSSITKLSLSYCNLEIEENVSVQWNHLKSLKIEHPSYMTENAISRILSGAPLLEELMLLSVDIDESLNIRYNSLKLLKIGRDDCLRFMTVVNAKAMLNIWAPNLLSLHISGCIYATCLLDVPSLTNAILCFKKSCDDTSFRRINDKFPPLEMFDHVFRRVRHVETLIVSALSIQLLIEMKEKDVDLRFPNTKFLKLYGASGEEVLDVLGMFPEVVSLVIEIDKDRIYDLDIDLVYPYMLEACKSSASEMNFLSPSLLQVKTVEFAWPVDHVSIIPMTKVLLKNTPMLEKMVIKVMMDDHDQIQRTLKLERKKVRSMPRSSPNARVIIKIW